MKFPKSLHAEGWANHIDRAPGAAGTVAPKKPGAGAKPWQAARPSTDRLSADLPPVTPAMSAAPGMAPRVSPASPSAAASVQRPTRGAATLPPQRDSQLPWLVVAGGGAAIVAALAVWAMNRPDDAPVTPPALVTGSAEPATQVAAVTPEPPPAADRDTADAAPAAPEVAEPARLGPPVTTVRPAPEVPAPRPDLVLRANPRSSTAQPERTTPYLLPSAPVAAAPAPVAEVQPLAVAPVSPAQATAPLTPPTAAVPAAAAAPVADAGSSVAPPVSTSPGTPPLAQAPAAGTLSAGPEDSGISQQVRVALASDATLAGLPIAVTTERGVVRLEGQAPDAPTRERAAVVASATSGVRAVDNRLTVAPPAVVSQAPNVQ